MDVNFTDDYLFLTLNLEENGGNSPSLNISSNDGYIVASKLGTFPTVALQSRGSNLTIYEFGAKSTPYSPDLVSVSLVNIIASTILSQIVFEMRRT